MSGIQSSMTFPTLPKSPTIDQQESNATSIAQVARNQAGSSRPQLAASTSAARASADFAAPLSPDSRDSMASDASSTTQDSAPSSSYATSTSAAAGPSIGFPRTARPISHASQTSSRPSSVASNSSSGASSHVHGQLAACPGILSPGLATALGLVPSHGASSLSRQDSSASRPHRRIRAQSSHGPTSAPRRPSLPIVPSMHHRMSVASVSSFESLPEDEIVHGFGMTSGPGGLPKARHSSYERANAAGARTLGVSPSADSVGASSGRSGSTSPPSGLSRAPTTPASTQPFPSSTSPVASPSKLSHQVDIEQFAHDRDGSSSSSASTSTRPSLLLKRSATDPAQSTGLQQMLQRRKNATLELLNSERSFMSSLELLDEEYYQPLMASLGRGPHGTASPTLASGAAPILDRKAVVDIFSNFSDIHHLSKELLSRLEDRLRGTAARPRPLAASAPAAKSTDSAPAGIAERAWDPALDTIGDILVPLAPFMKMYSLYVKNFSGALQRIESERKTNETFATFLRETEQRRQAKERSDSTTNGGKSFGFGLGFQAHLLTIVQRIPRYKLLVDDLIRNTPETHVDRPDLVRAGNTIEQVASYINENVRQHEMVLMMLSLQRSLQGLTEPLVVPGRSLIKRGTLMKTCRRNVQPREFFLFTDCIIYASPISGGIESASAAWLALAQRGGLYGGGGGQIAEAAAAAGSALEHASPGDASAAIETVLPRTRLRTISGPEAYTPLAGAIFSLAGHQLQFRDKFALRDCTVVSVDDHSLHGLRYCFEIRTPGKSFAVYAETMASKEAWVAAIREAKAEHLSARRTLRAEEDSIEARRDKRRSFQRVEMPVSSSRRLSTQSLGHFIGLSSAPTSIPEAESESAEPEVGSDALAAARTRTESAPNIFRPPSFPSFPANATGIALATLLSNSAAATPTKPLRVLEDYNAPVWVPDNRAEKCACCSEGFGMWRRKHHCRLCGQVVCWNCSQRSFLIPAYNDGEEDKPARACDSCYDSVFPPDSPEDAATALPPQDDAAISTLPAAATDAQAMSVTMAPGVSNDGSASGRSVSSGLFDSDTSPGSPATPGMDLSPHFTHHHGPSPLGSPPSSATIRPDLMSGQDKVIVTGAARPKSLRFENLPLPGLGPAEKRVYGDSPPKIPTRSKSISGNIGLVSERSVVAEAQLFNAALLPQVQAATSGSGTFRLITPRLTTPDSEVPPNQFGRRASHTPSMLGGVASYFGALDLDAGSGGGAALPASASSSSSMAGSDEVAGANAGGIGRGSEPFKPSMIHGPNGIPAHLRPQKRRPMSAADRLSIFNLGQIPGGDGRKK